MITIDKLTVRRCEVAVGVILLLISGAVIRESVSLGSRWGPSGPQPGFFPFWSASIMAVGVVIATLQSIREASDRPLYGSRGECVEVLKVGGPLVAAVLLLPYLGFYLMTAAYMGVFAAWYGRYRWYVALAAAVVLPLVLFVAFEQGFKILLPKSILYGKLTPF